MKKRRIIGLALVMALVAITVSGTLAYLMDKPEPVTNTFEIGKVDIDLREEHKSNKEGLEDYHYYMTPGSDIVKDPKITVKADSEDCWVYVKIEKSENFDTYLEYTVADGWTPLDGVDNVYYRQGTANDGWSVLANDKVTVKTSVTAEQAALLEDEANRPTLTFTAYAIQKDNVADAATGWPMVSGN